MIHPWTPFIPGKKGKQLHDQQNACISLHKMVFYDLNYLVNSDLHWESYCWKCKYKYNFDSGL